MVTAAVGFVTAAVFLILTKKNGSSAQIFPKQITVDDNKIELSSVTGDCFSRNLQDVTKITETETCYILDFRLPNDVYYICQKDLITEGTTGEFEKLFEGKIVKEKLQR